MIRLWALLSLVATLPCAVAQSSVPTKLPVERLLAHVPEDTALVLVVPNVEKLAAGLADFGEVIGVDELADLNARELIAELDLLDQVEGLDIAGPLVLAQKPSEPAPLLLCVLKDAEAWKRAAGAKLLEGGLMRVLVCGESGCAAVRGDVLVVGEEPETVRAALRADGKFAQRFQARAGKLLKAHHLVIYADVSEWRASIDTTLMAVRMSVRMALAMSASHDEDAIEWVDSQIDALVKVVRQVDVWVAGLRSGAEGVSVETAASFESGGSVADYLKKVRRTTRPLLRGLPARDSMMVMACEWEVPPGTQSLNACWLEAVLATPALKKKLGDAAHEKAMKAMLAMQDEMTGYNIAVTPATDAQGMLITGLYFTDDPRALAEDMRAAYAISAEFINPLGAGSTMEVSARNERVGSTDVYAFDMAFKTEDPQAQRMMEAMYGKATTIYTVARDEDVAFVMGPIKAARAELHKLLGREGGKLTDDKRVAAATAAISPNPQACLLVDPTRFLTFALNAARATSQPVPGVDFGDKPTPFLTCGVYLQPDHIRVELVVPAEPIKAMIDGFRHIAGADAEY